MQLIQQDDPAEEAPVQRSRLLVAGRATARWILAFGLSFGVTAGVLILAHV